MIAIPKTISFTLGQIVATPGALEAIEQAGQTPTEFLQRHSRGDWGNVCPEDWNANDAALDDGTRLMSAYELSSDVVIWVISEADRSATTILLPEEY